MKLRCFSAILVAATLVAGIGAIPRTSSATTDDAMPDSWRPSPLRLVGVWDVQVTLRDCVSGHAIATFPAMNQYSADGSQLEFGTNMPPSARYPSLGTWRFLGLHKFASEFRFFRFNPDGSYAGIQQVKRIITLSNDAHHFATRANVTIYDPQQRVVMTGCATERAARR